MMIEKTQEKIQQLEEAIKHLDSVIKHLGFNAGEMKTQIHTSISRHLEVLRNREVWLLNQVDLVVGAKEEVLHHQQVRLNKALGVLQSSIDLTDDDDSLDARLADALEKLNIVDMKPEETPHIAFRADQSALRETILNYGRVDPTGLPLQSAFVAHGHPSTCLPRHFEEYEDAEHHVFYKTVEEVHRARTASNNISVNIPRLSHRQEDWLCCTNTLTTSSKTSPLFSFPPFSPNTADWLRNDRRPQTLPQTLPQAPPQAPPASSDASIQNWLSQIKQFQDLEEEDFEIVDRDAGSSRKSSYSVTAAFPAFEKTAAVDPYMKMTYPSPVEAFLKSTSRVVEKSCEPEVIELFKHIPIDQDHWLMKTTSKEVESCADCVCFGQAVDIENLANTTGSSCTSHPQDAHYWLKPSYDVEGMCDNLSTNSSTCRANEPCATFDECICQPRCGHHRSKSESPKRWLKVCSSKPKLSPLPLIEGFTKYLKSLDAEKEVWLKGSGEQMNVCNLENDTLDKMQWFDCISSNPDDWLKEKQTGLNKNALDFDYKHGKEDHNMWLKVTGSQTPIIPCTGWESFENRIQKLTTSDWLLKPSKDSEDKDNGDEKDDLPDKWLLTQTLTDNQLVNDMDM